MKRPDELERLGEEQTAQRNVIRGIIGKSRSRTNKKDQPTVKLQIKREMRSAFQHARIKLQTDQYNDYFKWTAIQTEIGIPSELKDNKINLLYLDEVKVSKSLSLERELLWTANLISLASKNINNFRQLATRVEEAVWKQDFRTTLKLFAKIQHDFGHSFWLIDLKIALRQWFFGLDSQKKYVARLKKNRPSGIISFLAHYISVKNEPSVSPIRFSNDIIKKIETATKNRQLREYLKFKLASENPKSNSGAAAILQTAQSQSVIDLYETFLAIVANLIGHSPSNPTIRNIQLALEKIAEIDDWRLDKLAIAIGARRDISKLKTRSLQSMELLLKGEYRESYIASINELRYNPDSSTSLHIAGFAASMLQRESPLRRNSLRQFVIDRLAQLFAKGKHFDQSLYDLVKLSRNFSTMTTFGLLESTGWNLALSRQALPSRLLVSRSLGNQSLEPLDLIFAHESYKIDIRNLLEKSNRNLLFLQSCEFVVGGGNIPHQINEDISRYLKAEFLVLQDSYENAIDLLKLNLDGPRSALHNLSGRLLVECAIQSGNHKLAIQLIAKLLTMYPSADKLYPIEDAIGELKWVWLAEFSADISLSVVLDVLWRNENPSQIDTIRRFAFEEFLASQGVDTPSQLEMHIHKFESPLLIYFLKNVCTGEVMDMATVFTSSRQIMEERRRICGVLCQLDPDEIQTYQDEIFLISRQLAILDGMRVVDSSRLHVDSGAINRWAENELKEDFDRYRSLVALGIGVADDLNEVILSLRNEVENSKYALMVPQNEADDLLIEIIEKLKHEFLLNPTYGFNSYLSKRVRHGSVPNYLRSPAEKEHLITVKNALTGKYTKNQYWMDKLKNQNSIDLEYIETQLFVFSEEFDRLIIKVKDDLLQIQSAEHPNGFFSIVLTVPILHLLRVIIQMEKDNAKIVPIVQAMFWQLLDPKLKTAHSYLSVRLKAEVLEVFERLRAGIFGPQANTNPLAELSKAIGDTCTEVQRQADVVADWFRKGGGVQASHTFSIQEAIDIGVASVLNGLRGFELNVKVNVLGNKSITTDGLMDIHEIILVAIDNIYKHSGITINPFLEIAGEFHSDRGVLDLKFLSPLAKEKNCKSNERYLERIREKIRDGSGVEQLSKEGGTGLIKIADRVQQSGDSGIKFGFEGDDHFLLHVRLPIAESSAGDSQAAAQ